MAERHTLEGWAARLNVAGEPVTMEEAMLLNLGCQVAYQAQMLIALQDIQMRLQRMETFIGILFPGADAAVCKRLKALVEAKNGAG